MLTQREKIGLYIIFGILAAVSGGFAKNAGLAMFLVIVGALVALLCFLKAFLIGLKISPKEEQ